MLINLLFIYLLMAFLLSTSGVVAYVANRSSVRRDEESIKMSAELAVFAWVWPVILLIFLLTYLPDLFRLPYDIFRDAFKSD